MLESEERSDGIHASDLLDIRKAFFRHTDPQPLTEREAWTFLVGKLLHAFILVTIDGREFSFASGEESRHSDLLNIEYSPDKLMKGNIPREVKTTRGFYPPKEDKKGSVENIEESMGTYVEQTMIYMAAENKTEGALDILYLNHPNNSNMGGKTAPKILSYKVSISKDDLEKMQSYLKKKRDRLESAISTGKFQELPLCRDWLCKETMCGWWHACQPEGRYGVEKVKTKKGNKS